jgi:5'(3')-deoxyribonucleotidase
MRQLVIAIDCDDVLLPSTRTIVDLYNQRHNTNVTYARAHTSGNEEWAALREEVRDRIHAVQLSEEYANIQPFPEAVVAVRQLAADGHRLHMVTARDSKLLQATEAMLKEYFDEGVFTTLEHVGLDGTKGDVCQRLQADVLIDDSLKHLANAAEYGIDGLLWFGDYPWQGGDQAFGGAVHCVSWADVEREIERIANS